jgi:magnesium chelatase family protein
MVVSMYQKRISGPLLDRIDIHVEVLRVVYEKLSQSHLASRRHGKGTGRGGPPTTTGTFDGNAQHLEGAGHVSCNADIRPAKVRKFCALDETGKGLIQSAMNQLQL